VPVVVHHLNCGTLCPVAGLTLRGLARGRMVCHCLLLETPRDGLILVDTGFGTADLAGTTGLPRAFRALTGPALDPQETAVARVRALGHRPGDVRHVVVTHLDLDHAGGLADFPAAAVHLHARELTAATTRRAASERQRYLPAQWAHAVRWEPYAEDGDAWRGLPAVARLRGVDAEVALVPTHGHTRGHTAVAVRTGDRWLLHAGDAYFRRGALTGEAPVPASLRLFERLNAVDDRARRGSLAALRALAAQHPDVTVFSAHDADEFDALDAARAPG
jgi:glyoxylase-like metal-dependent hydrolase (beta-lactamase superfamily II)